MCVVESILTCNRCTYMYRLMDVHRNEVQEGSIHVDVSCGGR